MLCVNKDRFSADQVLKHKWFENKTMNTENSFESVIGTIKKYTNFNKFKKAVLTYIASRLKDEEIKILKEIFQTLDLNNDGTITLDEFKHGIIIFLLKVFHS